LAISAAVLSRSGGRMPAKISATVMAEQLMTEFSISERKGHPLCFLLLSD